MTIFLHVLFFQIFFQFFKQFFKEKIIMKIFKAIFLSALLVCTGQAFSQVCLNIPNTKKTTYTLLSGGTMTNQAEGKAKILVFFQVNDAKSREVAKNITSSYSSLASSVDICFVETKRSSKALVTKFRDTYASSSVNIAYDSTTASAISMQEYMKVLFGKAASIANPLVVYISADNKIRHEDHGKKLTVADIKDVLSGCMGVEIKSSSGTSVAAGTSSSSNSVSANAGSSSAKSAAAGTSAEIQGLNLANIKTYTYTLLDGTKVTNQANGKPKILIFCATWCSYCKKLTTAIAYDYKKFSDIDIYDVMTETPKEAEVQTYVDATNAKNLKVTNGCSAGEESYRAYHKLLGGDNGYPNIVFIDGNNKIQYHMPGSPTGDMTETLRLIVDYYLLPSASSNSNTKIIGSKSLVSAIESLSDSGSAKFVVTGAPGPQDITKITAAMNKKKSAKFHLDMRAISNSYGFYLSKFAGCTSLETLSLPSFMTNIIKNSFNGCTSLKNISIPENVTFICEGAFRNCTSLKKVYIPNNVKEIEIDAFTGCTSLSEVNIPKKIHRVSLNAFDDCPSLKKITFEGTIAQWKSVERYTSNSRSAPKITLCCTDGETEF